MRTQNTSPASCVWVTQYCAFREDRGFTILELVTVVGLVTTLLLFLTPALKNARESARQVVCRGNSRSAGLMLLSSSVDNQEAWPNAGENVREMLLPDGESTLVGGTRGLSSGKWALLYPDSWAGEVWDRALRCPRQPRVGEGPVPTMLPLLWMSRAMWLDPATLVVGHEERARWARTRVADVVFPSRKAVLFEQVAFCVEVREAQAWRRMGQTPYWPVSVALVDGSVRRATRAAELEGAWTMAFDATVEGVRGRDLRD